MVRNCVQARLASHKGMISLRELQSATGEELDTYEWKSALSDDEMLEKLMSLNLESSNGNK